MDEKIKALYGDEEKEPYDVTITSDSHVKDFADDDGVLFANDDGTVILTKEAVKAVADDYNYDRIEGALFDKTKEAGFDFGYVPDGFRARMTEELNEAYKNALESIASDIVKKYSKYLEEFRFEV